jgi:hypothetical protein
MAGGLYCLRVHLVLLLLLLLLLLVLFLAVLVRVPSAAAAAALRFLNQACKPRTTQTSVQLC